MFVRLRRNWFGPDGAQYRKGLVEISGDLEKQLPSDAIVVSEEKPKALKKADETPKADEKKAEADKKL